MIRLLVVDDHAVVRESVRRILDAIDDIAVTGKAAHAQEAYDALATDYFDMVLLDVSLPCHNGLECLNQSHTLYPDLPVWIFSVHPERQYVVQALRNGAAGYLLKSSAPWELVTAVRKITPGEPYVSAALVDHIIHAVAGTGDFLHAILTPREAQVLRLLASGYAMKEIAYRTRMLAKLKLRTTADLIRYALQHDPVP